jgi:hypothetical protein
LRQQPEEGVVVGVKVGFCDPCLHHVSDEFLQVPPLAGPATTFALGTPLGILITQQIVYDSQKFTFSILAQKQIMR